MVRADRFRRERTPARVAGLPAGPGAASGQIYFTAEAAVEAAEKGQKVILTRQETSPEDLRGMIAAEGILTTRGGASSHAALVARQMGKVCVCGAHGMEIDYSKKTLSGAGVTLKEGDFLNIQAHNKHKVEWTDPNIETVWLAVHY